MSKKKKSITSTQEAPTTNTANTTTTQVTKKTTTASVDILEVISPPTNDSKKKRAVFDHNAAKYRCCCGCMHVKTGVIIIAILSIFNLIYPSWSAYSSIAKNEIFSYSLIVTLFIWVPIIICLFIGTLLKNRHFFLPYYIYGTFIGFVLVLLIFILLLIVGLKLLGVEVMENYSIGEILFEMLDLFIESCIIGWFTWVVKRCYYYFRDLKHFHGSKFVGLEP